MLKSRFAGFLILILAVYLPVTAVAGCAKGAEPSEPTLTSATSSAIDAAGVARVLPSATAANSRPAITAPAATATVSVTSTATAAATAAATATKASPTATASPVPTPSLPAPSAEPVTEQPAAVTPKAQDSDVVDAAAEQAAGAGGAMDGLAVYQAQFCGICHQLATAGTNGMFGPAHNGMAVVAGERITDPDYGGDATTAEAYLRESILEPERYIVPGYESSSHRMPAYTTLSTAQVDALIQMLLEQQ